MADSSAQSGTVSRVKTCVTVQNCKTCGKVFANKEMKVHRMNCKLHTVRESRQCRQCGRTFVRLTALEAHEKRCNSSVGQDHATRTDQFGQSAVTQPGGRVPCPACAKTFTVERSMRTHFATFHGLETVPKPFACDVCGQAFVRANLLAVHRRTHTGDRPFQCEICGRGFICRGELNKHHRLHVDGYMYKCGLCGKEMKTSRESADHRRQHAGGIACPVCGKHFTRYLNMKTHVRGTHGGERRFVCVECGKSFVYAQNLRHHRRAHGPLRRNTTTPTDNHASTVVENPPLFCVKVLDDSSSPSAAASFTVS